VVLALAYAMQCCIVGIWKPGTRRPGPCITVHFNNDVLIYRRIANKSVFLDLYWNALRVRAANKTLLDNPTSHVAWERAHSCTHLRTNNYLWMASLEPRLPRRHISVVIQHSCTTLYAKGVRVQITANTLTTMQRLTS